jgi:hypothetical protein
MNDEGSIKGGEFLEYLSLQYLRLPLQNVVYTRRTWDCYEELVLKLVYFTGEGKVQLPHSKEDRRCFVKYKSMDPKPFL